MGQKTNSNIFRLGIKTNEWKCKYFENTLEEHSLYAFQNLEIQKFIERFLNLNGLLLHNYKLQFSKNTLHIYISYLISDKTISLIYQTNNIKYEILKSKKTKKKKIPYRRLKVLTKYKTFNETINYIKKDNILNTKNLYIEQFLESLSIFTKRRFNIIATFRNLNKELDLLNKTEKKIIEKQKILRRSFAWNAKQGNKNAFFESSFQILPIVVTKKDSAKILAEFIALHLTYMKAHTFFLKFITSLLTTFSTAYFSKISGIKIVVKGRFNRAQRAKKKLIVIGEIPLQTFDSIIDYHQSVSYTPNGTFGIKVWICYKN